MKNLVPGSQYDFEIYATSHCGESLSAYVEVETTMKGEHFLMTLIQFLYLEILCRKYTISIPLEFCFFFPETKRYCLVSGMKYRHLQSCYAI